MYWIIASFIMFAVFCIWSRIEVSIKMKQEDDTEKKFWKRELEANSVRRKPIDHLDYIKVPDNLPVDLLKDNDDVQAIIATINNLKDDKILNLTGYTNTDLKLEYGAPNITELSKYDQSYTLLVTSLQKWADILIDNGYQKEAIDIMEYLVSTKADIGKTYRLLAKFYKAQNMNEKFTNLIAVASSLKSLNGPNIVTWLKDYQSQ